MAVKRKQHSQSATLHKFFSGAPGSTKNVTVPDIKGKQRAFPTQEIIVIDSDDDLTPVSKKNRRKGSSSSNCSSDIEIVDVKEVVKRPSTKLKPKNNAPNIDGNVFKNASDERGALLQQSNPPEAPKSRQFQSQSVSDYALFGKPSKLLSSSPIPLADYGDHTISTTTSHSTVNIGEKVGDASCTKSLPADMQPFPSDEDWNMGDDEQASIENYLNEESEGMVVDSSVGVAEDAHEWSTCPVCELCLSGISLLEIQAHINRCLDASSTSALPAVLSSLNQTPQSKGHHPLSSSQSIQPIFSTSQLKLCESKPNGNAFTLLMSSHKESAAWKEATIAEDRNFRPSKDNGGRRKAPFYKVLQGMPIAVDAFRYGIIPNVTAYFLTHAHSDHYTNLASNWKSGPIYCSHGTANLIIHMLSVDPKWVHPLPMDVPYVIPNTGGVCVTLIEANHCPGSCLFLFEGLQTVNAGDSAFKSPFVGSSQSFRYLHCGDFRASPQHVLHPAVKGKRIDTVYLDTTYLDPKYAFPPQPLVVSACAELAKRLVAGHSTASSDGMMAKTMDDWMVGEKSQRKEKEIPQRMLVVVGTYSIGKERIVKAIAQALETKVYCDARKAAILRCQNDTELQALLTSDPLTAGVHVVPLGIITTDRLKAYVERFKGTFSKAVGFRPTGWAYVPPRGSETSPSISSIISQSQQCSFTYAHLRPARNATPMLQLFGVPYSEHSSFFELTCFALSLDWGKMIATVNVGSEKSRGKMARWMEKWEAERKKQGKDFVINFRDADYW